MKSYCRFSNSISIFLCEFLHCFLSKKFAIRFDKETANENKQFKETKTFIFTSYLIRHKCQGYRRKSGIVIFAWMVTWNYAYSPFNAFNNYLQTASVLFCRFFWSNPSIFQDTTFRVSGARVVSKPSFKADSILGPANINSQML